MVYWFYIWKFNNKVTKDDFKFLYIIGKGGFCNVWKVKNKWTGQYFALKQMTKTKIRLIFIPQKVIVSENGEKINRFESICHAELVSASNNRPWNKFRVTALFYLPHILIIKYYICGKGKNPADWIWYEDCCRRVELWNQENCKEPDDAEDASPD